MRKPNTICSECESPIYRRPSELKRWKNHYCSECQPIKHRKRLEEEYEIYIQKWKRGEVSGLRGKYQISKHIVRYLFKKYENKCCECGWSEINKYTGNIPLEVEHVDGDYTNCYEENLKLLCPNCHSLTPTYKGANRGNGRKNRK